MNNETIYKEITGRILEKIARGVVPWRRPWAGGVAGRPKNLVTKKPYRGINVFILALSGYTSPYWVTYQQAREKGAFVRKGERGTRIVFWRFLDRETGETDEEGEPILDSIPLTRVYTVFNLEQVEGLTDPDPVAFVPAMDHFQKIEAAEKIVRDFRNGPAIQHGGDRACYQPGYDRVRIPDPGRFDSSEEYYSTLFHELGHATGHKERLAREGIMGMNFFGSHSYSKEELIAEFTAAFLCGQSGIERTLDNSAAYLQSWLKVLRDNERWLITAAQQAQKAADFILESGTPQAIQSRIAAAVTELNRKFGADAVFSGRKWFKNPEGVSNPLALSA